MSKKKLKKNLNKILKQEESKNFFSSTSPKASHGFLKYEKISKDFLQWWGSKIFFFLGWITKKIFSVFSFPKNFHTIVKNVYKKWKASYHLFLQNRIGSLLLDFPQSYGFSKKIIESSGKNFFKQLLLSFKILSFETSEENIYFPQLFQGFKNFDFSSFPKKFQDVETLFSQEKKGFFSGLKILYPDFPNLTFQVFLEKQNFLKKELDCKNHSTLLNKIKKPFLDYLYILSNFPLDFALKNYKKNRLIFNIPFHRDFFLKGNFKNFYPRLFWLPEKIMIFWLEKDFLTIVKRRFSKEDPKKLEIQKALKKIDGILLRSIEVLLSFFQQDWVQGILFHLEKKNFDPKIIKEKENFLLSFQSWCFFLEDLCDSFQYWIEEMFSGKWKKFFQIFPSYASTFLKKEKSYQALCESFLSEFQQGALGSESLNQKGKNDFYKKEKPNNVFFEKKIDSSQQKAEFISPEKFEKDFFKDAKVLVSSSRESWQKENSDQASFFSQEIKSDQASCHSKSYQKHIEDSI